MNTWLQGTMCLFLFFILVLVQDIRNMIKDNVVQDMHMNNERISLPEKCHTFYNDGTGRWADCMGVGYK